MTRVFAGEASPSAAWRDPPLVEVRTNILSQQIGAATVADFDMPDEFVRRVADHIYREAFQRQFRIVPSPPVPPPATSDATSKPATSGRVELNLANQWAALSEVPPPLRGFRAAVAAEGASAPFRLAPDAAAPLQQVATDVAQRLARDGLLAVTARALIALVPLSGDDAHRQLELLMAAGVPVDLLAYFDANREGDRDWRDRAKRVITALHGLTRAGIPAPALSEKLRSWPFAPQQSGPLFLAASESGNLALEGLRMHCTRGDNWTGTGGGDSVDVVLQLISAAPDCRGLAQIQSPFAPVFTANPRWSAIAGRVRVLDQELPLSQWAQDNGKPGFIEQNGATRSATLVPRYASRSEERSVFVAGEQLAVAASAGEWPLAPSPLLFQGGNLLIVQRPGNGGRVLLIGEAEIYRNISLGLRRAQVEAAFAAELGAAQVVVLPAASFHIDLEVTCRTTSREVVAFVNDCEAGARLIAHAGLDAGVAGQLWSRAEADEAGRLLDADRVSEFLAFVLPAMQRRQAQAGMDPVFLAQHFSSGPADRGSPNLRRFLIALDYLLAGTELAERMDSDVYTGSYLRSLLRTRDDRTALRKQLERLGWRVVGVPSFEETGVAVNTINGIHDRTRYFMPVHGGLFANLDRAAEAVFRRELGADVQIVPIPTNETQTRAGGLHCAVSAYYRRE